jgi:hypothetical protein
MFEHRFSPWQEGIRLDKAVYPFAQRIAACGSRLEVAADPCARAA